jgi:hypothetical protein
VGYTTAGSSDFLSLLSTCEYDVAVMDHPSSDPAGA